MRTGRRENGFTLVELLVVVMILGTLMAIVVPTFLGTRASADDRAAQTVVRHSLIAVRAVPDSTTPTPAALASTEPQLHYRPGDEVARAATSEVSVASGGTGGQRWVVLASLSTSGRCFALVDHENGTVGYRREAGATCKAEDFDPDAGWSDSWP
jgi:prepilin-type N-terminal cleavage/methylation domain-containing protein